MGAFQSQEIALNISELETGKNEFKILSVFTF